MRTSCSQRIWSLSAVLSAASSLRKRCSSASKLCGWSSKKANRPSFNSLHTPPAHSHDPFLQEPAPREMCC